MSTAFRCGSQLRRDRVRTQPAPTVNGIDWLEVDPADQSKLRVHFVLPLPGAAHGVPQGSRLSVDNVVIEGGVRVTGIRVERVTTRGNLLTAWTSASGDFSTYTLRLVDPSKPEQPPDGFDRQLASIAFSFKASCPSPFDCRDERPCPPEPSASPAIDYLAKDYASFRRLMLDRLSVLMPDWRERSPADLTIAITEVLAYVADHLSQAQDAIGTEMYLGTARRRVSVRRHARLLDYSMHDGCNARAWVVVTPRAAATLPAGTVLLAAGAGLPSTVAREDVPDSVLERTVAFETLHDLRLVPAHARIRFHAWSEVGCCLPAGATHATLRDEPKGSLELQEGDVLVLEELRSATTGLPQDRATSHVHAVRITHVDESTRDEVEGVDVREVHWAESDALPFALCVSAVHDGVVDSDVSVARGNVVLADHGWTLEEESLAPLPRLTDPDPTRAGRRRLARTAVTQSTSYDHARAVRRPAKDALDRAPEEALPSVRLSIAGEGERWTPRRDLLAADRFERAFVAEVEDDGVVTLRFGDGVHGRAPAPGTAFLARYRVGNGRAGNVGAGSIATAILDRADLRASVLSVRNPMAATGGVDPESMEEVRQHAPEAFRVQARAVTEDDYARAAESHPGVQRAAARLRWTGSWYTMFVTVDRLGGASAAGDAAFVSGLRARLERLRIVGYDLEIVDPVQVPLDISVRACVRPGFLASDVQRALLSAFSSGVRPDGARGFFHPDERTFGEPLYLSRLVAAAMAVPGVARVDVEVFQRWGRAPNREIDDGLIRAGALEVLRLDNDPNFPENGRIAFEASAP